MSLQEKLENNSALYSAMPSVQQCKVGIRMYDIIT